MNQSADFMTAKRQVKSIYQPMCEIYIFTEVSEDISRGLNSNSTLSATSL